MEEVNTIVEAVETQPQETAAETTAEETTEQNETAAENTNEAAEAETTGNESASTEDGFVLPVKFNKQIKHLSTQDAIAYAQKGMNYDRLQPVLDSLKYVAAAEGKTLVEFAEAIRKQHEDNCYSALVDRCDGNEDLAKELFEVEKGKHKTAFESLIAAEKQAEDESDEAIVRRLADELTEARTECPEITEYSKLPASVRREVEEKSVPILDAYLRYQNREQRKAKAAQAEQAAAAKSSVGAQSSTGKDQGSDPVISALMKGIWG